MIHLNQADACSSNVVRLYEIEPTLLAFSMSYVEGGDLTRIERRGWSLKKKLLYLKLSAGQ